MNKPPARLLELREQRLAHDLRCVYTSDESGGCILCPVFISSLQSAEQNSFPLWRLSSLPPSLPLTWVERYPFIGKLRKVILSFRAGSGSEKCLSGDTRSIVDGLVAEEGGGGKARSSDLKHTACAMPDNDVRIIA